MKIVQIIGGLGNQMFQYAFALKLKHLYPKEKVLLDISDFQIYETRNYELGNVFNVTLPYASKLDKFRVFPYLPIVNKRLDFLRKEYVEEYERSFSFDEKALQIKKDCYYRGYWFCQDYFVDISDEIRSSYIFKKPLGDENIKLKELIDSTNSVSIHVRRGDYLLYDIFKNICEIDYYERAIKYIKTQVENPHFFIFSNDPDWCTANLFKLIDGDVTFSNNNSDSTNYVDMQLMACCKHNIIAHSSFSWWSSWLNTNPNKIVVAPKRWLNDVKVKNGPQLDSWILM